MGRGINPFEEGVDDNHAILKVDKLELAIMPTLEIFTHAYKFLGFAKTLAAELSPELYTKDQEEYLKKEESLRKALAGVEIYLDVLDTAMELQYPAVKKVTGWKAFVAALKDKSFAQLLKREEKISTRDGLLKKINSIKNLIGQLKLMPDSYKSLVKKEIQTKEIEERDRIKKQEKAEEKQRKEQEEKKQEQEKEKREEKERLQAIFESKKDILIQDSEYILLKKAEAFFDAYKESNFLEFESPGVQLYDFLIKEGVASLHDAKSKKISFNTKNAKKRIEGMIKNKIETTSIPK